MHIIIRKRLKIKIIIVYLLSSSALLFFSSFFTSFFPFAKEEFALIALPLNEAKDKVEATKFFPLPSNWSLKSESSCSSPFE